MSSRVSSCFEPVGFLVPVLAVMCFPFVLHACLFYLRFGRLSESWHAYTLKRMLGATDKKRIKSHKAQQVVRAVAIAWPWRAGDKKPKEVMCTVKISCFWLILELMLCVCGG
jgi:hypothetical protein